MCDFVSALRYEDKFYFLTDEKLDAFLRMKIGREWLKVHGPRHEDVKGHGFLKEYIYPELKSKAANWECTDFSSQKNFPAEIAKAIMSGKMTFALPDEIGQVLTKKAYADWKAKRDALDADYESKRAPLYADYESKRAPLDADYEAKRDALDADYEAKRDALDADWKSKRAPLYADWKAKRDALYADYESKRAPLDADWKAKRDALDADYESKRAPLDADWKAKRDALDADYEAKRDALDADWKAKRDALFWKLFVVKKNRATAWK
jgi:phage host-nuclease inhibitor protein Gam